MRREAAREVVSSLEDSCEGHCRSSGPFGPRESPVREVREGESSRRPRVSGFEPRARHSRESLRELAGCQKVGRERSAQIRAHQRDARFQKSARIPSFAKRGLQNCELPSDDCSNALGFFRAIAPKARTVAPDFRIASKPRR